MDDFDRLYAAEYQGIVRFAAGMLAGGGDADDVAQEAFLRWRRSNVPADRARFWLFRVARNLALNELRRRRRLEALRMLLPRFGAADDPHAQAADRQEQARLRAALEGLSAHLRAPLLLREWESMSYAEIAEALETSVAKVKSDIYRARQALRERMTRGER